MTDVNNTVLQKIQKLLSVADESSNAAIGETANAMALAQKLLRKHHLSMSQVLALDSGNEGSSDLLEVKEYESVSFKANVVPLWMMDLIKAVNRITQTKTLIKRTPREGNVYSELKIIFIGDPLDVLTASELFNFLRKSITKLSSKHQKESGGKFKQWRSFAEGCSDTLLTRSRAIDDKIDKGLDKIFESSTDDLDISNFELDDDDEYDIIDDDEFDDLLHDETALVLFGQYRDAKYQRISDYINDKEVEDEQSSSTTSKVDSNSYILGTEAGEIIPLKLNKQVEEH